MLYSYINSHAGTPKQRQKRTMDLDTVSLSYYVILGLGSGSSIGEFKEKIERIQTL